MEILEKRTHDYEMQLTRTTDELKMAKEQLAKVTEQEAALVQQNAKMSVELVAKEKKQEGLETELKSVKDGLKQREMEVEKMKEEADKAQIKHHGVAEGLEKELEEKNKTLKEYQDKVHSCSDCKTTSSNNDW